MQVPALATLKQNPPPDDPSSYAVAKLDAGRRHKRDMLRYLVLVVALVAVLLLIAIALYYTEGKSVSIEHVSSLAPSAVGLLGLPRLRFLVRQGSNQ